MRDEIRYINVFVIAFKETDKRMTFALRSMISLFKKMFGDGFWDNAILEVTYRAIEHTFNRKEFEICPATKAFFQATFWSHHNDAAERRNQTVPTITEAFWTKEFNRKLRQEFSLKRDLQAVFIDTYYNKRDPNELRAFNKNTNKLFEFANKSEPFACKDIKIALTEIRELTNSIDQAKEKLREKEAYIGQILEEINKYNNTLAGLATTPPRYDEYCVENRCYTPTEFALFGVGVIVMGMMVGVLGISGVKHKSLPERSLGNEHQPLDLDNSITLLMSEKESYVKQTSESHCE